MKANIDEAFILDQRKQLALKLKTIREQKGLSQTDLGDLVGMTAATINKIEMGRWNVNVDTLLLLTNKLGLTITFS